MGAHLITGYAGKAHITSGDTGMFNAAIIGGGKYVLPIGSMFEASIVTNNLVKVMDGCMVNQGRNINIPVNDYEECIIDNGLQGLKRNDLIVIRYSKDVETEIEKAETIVIKGVSGDTAVDPSYLTGDILAGAATDDFPLYRVKLDGLTITALEPMFNVMVSMNSLKESLAKCEDGLSTLNTNLASIYSQINNLQSLNPGTTHNLGLEANCAYLIFIGKYDTSTTSKYDGTNLSVYVATTTSVRTFSYPIVHNSGVTVSLTNLLLSITVPSDNYVRRLHIVKFSNS